MFALTEGLDTGRGLWWQLNKSSEETRLEVRETRRGFYYASIRHAGLSEFGGGGWSSLVHLNYRAQRWLSIAVEPQSWPFSSFDQYWVRVASSEQITIRLSELNLFSTILGHCLRIPVRLIYANEWSVVHEGEHRTRQCWGVCANNVLNSIWVKTRFYHCALLSIPVKSKDLGEHEICNNSLVRLYCR